MVECFVEALVVVGFAYLDGGTNDDVGAVTFEHRGQIRSLRCRTRNNNRSSLEWHHVNHVNPVILSTIETGFQDLQDEMRAVSRGLRERPVSPIKNHEEFRSRRVWRRGRRASTNHCRGLRERRWAIDSPHLTLAKTRAPRDTRSECRDDPVETHSELRIRYRCESRSQSR